jgi:hypothetical protein
MDAAKAAVEAAESLEKRFFDTNSAYPHSTFAGQAASLPCFVLWDGEHIQ